MIENNENLILAADELLRKNGFTQGMEPEEFEYVSLDELGGEDCLVDEEAEDTVYNFPMYKRDGKLLLALVDLLKKAGLEYPELYEDLEIFSLWYLYEMSPKEIYLRNSEIKLETEVLCRVDRLKKSIKEFLNPNMKGMKFLDMFRIKWFSDEAKKLIRD